MVGWRMGEHAEASRAHGIGEELGGASSARRGTAYAHALWRTVTCLRLNVTTVHRHLKTLRASTCRCALICARTVAAHDSSGITLPPHGTSLPASPGRPVARGAPTGMARAPGLAPR